MRYIRNTALTTEETMRLLSLERKPGPARTKQTRWPGFRWHTAEGEYLTLEEMGTRHVFMSMKMIFNHMTMIDERLSPVLFTVRYSWIPLNSPPGMLVVFFLREIERRGDLPDYLQPALDLIKSQVLAVHPGALAEDFPQFEVPWEEPEEDLLIGPSTLDDEVESW